MAYTPIQMPETSGVGQGLSSLQGAFVRMAQANRQEQADLIAKLRGESEDKRQAQQDFQRAYAMAAERAQAGDLQGAHAILAPYGAQIQERQTSPSNDWAPQLNQDEVDFAGSLDQFRGAGPVKPQAPPGPAGEASPSPAGAPAIEPPPMQQEPPQAPQATPQAPGNPLVRMAQADQAKKAQMAQYLKGKFMGQDFTLDPEAQRSAQLQRSDEAMRSASGEGTDMADIIREQYPAQRAAALAAGKPLDAEEMMKGFAGESRLRSQENRADARQTASDDKAERAYQRHLDDQAHADEQRQLGWDQAMKRAGVIAQPGLKIDTANRGDASNLERGVRDYVAAADAKTLLKGNRTLHAAMANIAAGGDDAVMAHKDSFLALERYSRGGTPTDSETHLFLNSMGGIPGALEKFYADAKNGDFSDVTKRNIAMASRVALKENDENVSNLFEGMKTKFGPGSSWSNMGPQVNREVRSLGKVYGLDLPDLYPEGEGQNQGAVLGSGKRPSAQPKAQNKLVTAARASSLPPADKAAVDWAVAHPGDPRAAAILKLHGM